MGYWLWKIKVMTYYDENMESLQKIEMFNLVVAHLLRENTNGCPHDSTST